MNVTRREVLGGGIAAMVGGVSKRMATEGERSSAPRCGGFPVLWLELIEKRSWLGDFKCRLAAARLVSVDLDVEDEWGDLNRVWVDGQMRLGLGDDEGGYWLIERAYEIMSPNEELHEGKFPVAYELSMEELDELISDRIASWT